MAEELVKQGNQVFVICRSLKENKKYVENGVNITRIFVEQTKIRYGIMKNIGD